MMGMAFCRGDPNPARHEWQRTPVPAWWRCRACRVVGVCTVCYAKLELPVPQGAVPMQCPEHQRVPVAPTKGGTS